MITFAERVTRIGFAAQQLARLILALVDCCLPAETETAESVAQRLFAKPFTETAKIIVARVGDGFRWIEGRQVSRMSTDGMKIFTRIVFATQSVRVLINQSRPQRGECRERFDRRARRIRVLKRDPRIHNCAHPTSLRIHHYDRSFLLAQGVRSRALQRLVHLSFGVAIATRSDWQEPS